MLGSNYFIYYVHLLVDQLFRFSKQEKLKEKVVSLEEELFEMKTNKLNIVKMLKVIS